MAIIPAVMIVITAVMKWMFYDCHMKQSHVRKAPRKGVGQVSAVLRLVQPAAEPRADGIRCHGRRGAAGAVRPFVIHAPTVQ
eukprot:scaffold8790_cov46-Prasinocladus_malaysianus.AAC.1